MAASKSARTVTPDHLTEVVNKWFQEKMRSGAVAGHTPSYNQVFAAKDDLIARLHALLPKSPAKETTDDDSAE